MTAIDCDQVLSSSALPNASGGSEGSSPPRASEAATNLPRRGSSDAVVEMDDIYDLAAPRRLGGEQSAERRRQREAAMEQVAKLAATFRKDMEQSKGSLQMRRVFTTPDRMFQGLRGGDSHRLAESDDESDSGEEAGMKPTLTEKPRPAADWELKVARAAQAAQVQADAPLQKELSMAKPLFEQSRLEVPATPLSPMTWETDSPMSPPISRLSSSCTGWEGADSTVILFDWDDTLFPTTFMRFEVRPKQPEGQQNEPPPVDSPEYEALAQHAELLHDVLTCARSIGQVAIITLSTRPWVLTSAERYLPDFDLPKLLEELDIPIYYAFEHLSKENRARAQFEEGVDVLAECKRHAMLRCLRKYYQGTRTRPHVISIGDSTAEQTAVKEVLWSWDDFSSLSSTVAPLCKTVKFIDEPSIDQLGAEMELLIAWLPRMAAFSKDFDFSMDDEDGLQGSAEQLSPTVE
mmetsp:Transcript_19056/g.44494  ORF Transcript_19056/g.44494 Transcript_19056/m.44494 type:complete len:463 (-) Transcript_19056:23-1411(-)